MPFFQNLGSRPEIAICNDLLNFCSDYSESQDCLYHPFLPFPVVYDFVCAARSALYLLWMLRWLCLTWAEIHVMSVSVFFIRLPLSLN